MTQTQAKPDYIANDIRVGDRVTTQSWTNTPLTGLVLAVKVNDFGDFEFTLDSDIVAICAPDSPVTIHSMPCSCEKEGCEYRVSGRGYLCVPCGAAKFVPGHPGCSHH